MERIEIVRARRFPIPPTAARDASQPRTDDRRHGDKVSIE